MNIILGIASIVITFSLVVLSEKLFKKEGLFVWMSFATITANILVCKSIDVLNIVTCLGNVMFASNFLATDILTEKYGYKESRKSVIMACFFQIIFVIVTQIALLYVPSDIDLANESMKTLFSINLRTSVSSVVMFFVSNILNVYFYEKIKEKIPNHMWLRNNLSTIIFNCLENYFFNFFAFVGIYSLKEIMTIATSTTIIEIVIALCDTPFLYLSKLDFKKLKGRN